MPSDERRSPPESDDDCLLPDAVPLTTRQGFSLTWTEHEALPIREYVESQTHGGTVSFLQRLTSERVFGRDYEVWDARTDRDRYWEVTSPTNLYSQDHFPSLDFLLSFHIGLMARVLARSESSVTAEERERFAVAWRHWSQATEPQERADEAEDFQAVGVRCRECLLEFVRIVADNSMVPTGQAQPKQGDFIHWSELVAQTIARGSSAEVVRGYMKASAREAWQYVNWLTHAKNATRPDGQLAVDATQHVLATFGAAFIRYEHGVPDRCGKCASYRITGAYRPDIVDDDDPYVTLCEICGSVRLDR